MSNMERNGSGCVDPTLDILIKQECECKKKSKEDYNYRKMMNNIRGLLKDNGYMLEGPISLINEKTGRNQESF